jgi:hypothetical protein
MVKSDSVFKRTRKTARMAFMMTYVGLGSCQLILVPPLGDPLGMIEE